MKTCSLVIFSHNRIRTLGENVGIREVQDDVSKTENKTLKIFFTFLNFRKPKICIPDLNSAVQKTTRKKTAKITDARNYICLKGYIKNH